MSRTISRAIATLLLLVGAFVALVQHDYARGAFDLILSHMITSNAREGRR